MKSTTLISTVGSVLLSASSAFAQVNTNPPTPQGCFSTQDPLVDQGFYNYQASGYCKNLCATAHKPVFALSQGSHCYCADKLPSANSKVDDTQCNTPCVGYPKENCGGQSTFQVSLSGLADSVPNVDGSSSTSTTSSSIPSSTSTPGPSTITQAGQTVVVTAPGQTRSPQSQAPSSSSGPNKAGIAAGVVVALVVVAFLIGGAFLLFKNRRKRAVEEEYRRNVAINSIKNGAKSPVTSSSGMSDSRLEPSVMAQRRMSDGSIADNQDYSRRILKVTNPS